MFSISPSAKYEVDHRLANWNVHHIIPASLHMLLFLIYVNDINRHVHLGSCNLYADDTLIYCTGSNIVELKTNIQKCVTGVHELYESNKLVINKYKSNVMLLTTRQMLSHMTDTDLNVCIGNYELLQCNNIKYIGVDIDNVLSWDMQTDSISKKLVFTNV